MADNYSLGLIAEEVDSRLVGIGDINALETSNKNSLVEAINELKNAQNSGSTTPPSSGVDTTLSQQGVAADAKTVGERLEAIEYREVVNEFAYLHEDLPEGIKNVIIADEGETFGNRAYAYSGIDLVPRKMFNIIFPYNGITMTRNDMTYHVEGTVSTSTVVYFVQNALGDNTQIEESLEGQTIRILSFANKKAGQGITFTATFCDVSGNSISGTAATVYVGQSALYASATAVVPAGARQLELKVSFPANAELDLDFQVYAVLDSQLTSISAEGLNQLDDSSTRTLTFPYKSQITTKAPINDYIKYVAQTVEGGKEVYIGSGPMPEDCVLQVNPDGDFLEIPTKLSQLENDCNFVTKEQLENGDFNLGGSGTGGGTFTPDGDETIIPDGSGSEILPAIDTDTTLTQEGVPADAKAVGDAISELRTDMEQRYQVQIITWGADD